MWNLYSAIRDREYGVLTGPGNNEQKSFSQNFFGSRFLMERMQYKEILSRRESAILGLTFSPDGDIICATFGSRLLLYNWEAKKVFKIFRSDHFEFVYKMFCRQCNANELDIILSGFDKSIKRAYIDPYGLIRFSTVFESRQEKPKFTIVPRESNEIIVGSARGSLHRVDLRLAHQSFRNKPITTVMDSDGIGLRIKGIAHHPFYPEICVFGIDHRMNIFDKRNYGTPLKKIIIENRDENGDANRDIAVHNCSYNYNGNVFLVDSSLGAHLVKNNENGDTLKFLDKAGASNFFGPKSSHIVTIEACSRMALYDENLKEIIKNETVGVGARSCSNIAHHQHIVQPHPKFPVIAFTHGNTGLGIWAPSNINFYKKSE